MKQAFNDHWRFQKKGGRWEMITLPHDAMLHEKRSAEAGGKSASGFFPGGQYIYEKEFELGTEEAEGHITFLFEGVYKNAKVFINEKEAGGGHYGYVPFYVAADGFVKEGKNVIRVEADNADQPDSRWYSGAGIYRPVWMYVQKKDHILLNGIRIKTLSVAPPEIEVAVKYQLQKEEGAGANVEVGVQILDDGRVLAEESFRQESGLEGYIYQRSGRIRLSNVYLWSEHQPKLYTAKVTLSRDGTVIEEREEKFGIRKVEWSPKGFFVNGKETLLRGGCIHHDNGILGAAEYEESAMRRIRILKEGGFNAIRSAHNPCSEAILKACDRLGMYIMDETWDMWYRKKSAFDYANDFMEHYKEDIRAMVERDFNHPSVVMYSIGNEVSEPAEEKGVKLAKEMAGLVHQLDDSRAVCGGYNLTIIKNSAKGKNMYKEDGGMDNSGEEKAAGMNSTMFNMIASIVGTGMNKAANGKKTDRAVSPVLDSMDIAGYNYASGRYKADGTLHPDRVIVGSETFPQDLAKNWEMVKKYPYLVGDFMWTAWDYIGEAGIGAWSYHEDGKGFSKPYPWLLADTGAYDILGNPNGEALWAKAVWDESGKPYLAVRPCSHPGEKLIKAVWRGTNGIPSWSFVGSEGNQAVVEVYTNAPVAELYLDGKQIGRKKTKDARAIFKVEYQPGTLAARALDASGREKGRAELVSAKKETGIRILPEKENYMVGEIAYLDVVIADKDGVVESARDTELTFSVENAELLGFGSADPRTEDRFDSGRYRTYYGRAQAVVRITNRGEVKIKAKGQGMKEENLVLKISDPESISG